MIEIIPAIIAHTYEEFEQKVKAVEPFVDRVHLDIMDGVFVPDKTIHGVEEINRIETPLDFDVHLMVTRPQHSFDDWLQTKAQNFFVHAESNVDLISFIRQVETAGKSAGVVLNPGTDINELAGVAHLLKSVQFMTVYPGQYGAEFVSGVIPKISAFHLKYPRVKIYVDGAMHLETAKLAVVAGASGIIMGGHIFSENRPVDESINELKESLRHF